MNDPPSETDLLIERLRAGDRRALAELFQQHRDRLRRMVELGMDARLQGRIDASDVLQDGFLDLAKRVDSYLSDPNLPAFLGMRLVVRDRLAMIHRHHLGTRMRDVSQEVSLYRDPLPQASSAALAAMLLGRLTSSSKAAIRAEQILQVQEAVNSLDPLDRKIVALAPFRAAQPSRDRGGGGHHRGGWSDALPPGRQEAQGDPGDDAWWLGRTVIHVDLGFRTV